MDQEKIGKFIAKMRHERKLTQEELGEKLGVTKNAISKWERGLNLMDMSLLKPLSDVLEIEVIDILYGEVVDKTSENKKYENMILELFKTTDLSKRKIKIQYFLFELIILILSIAIVSISDSEIVIILTITLMVVANSFNIAFYTLSKNVVLLTQKLNNK